ncbi:A/G-specific adenine glycosylase [Heliorestis convoluta]|uniref:Adenine DNA glycosylase n=1 Tax=Heliorestis convoluta TaxID=356322 RepID=A0A5Q2N0P1_9FIRM|nr:A/G-specific adenine glycosylase [Heliorestis convoluta]QGG47116.1 A/G-specific adenine glycosylase [Heliorestis convoluta]
MNTNNWVLPLLHWYEHTKRDLPWRQTKDPYRIWVSEIMLQQTRVETVIPYYERFLHTFPTVHDLAQSPLDQVLKAWEGLGYYSRAKNLHKAAQQIVQDYKGDFPQSYEALRRLPGVGDYTVGALLSIAFNQPYPAIDGNVLRVLSRVYCINEEISSLAVKKKMYQILKSLYPAGESSNFTQALMELGALVCIATSPRCHSCPITPFCIAQKKKMQSDLPIKKKGAKKKAIARSLALIQEENKVLLHQRPLEGLLGGLWEFPGIDGDSDSDRFFQEHGFKILWGAPSMTVRHEFTHLIWDMTLYKAQKVEPLSPLTERWHWFTVEELSEITIPSAFRKIVQSLKNENGL